MKDWYDDDIDDMLDDDILRLAKEIAADESGPSIVNPHGLKRMECVKKILDEIVSGVNVEIEFVPHSPFPSMGYISVIGKDVVITSSEMFAAAVNLSSNVEIFARVDDTAQMNFAFDGLTRKGKKS